MANERILAVGKDLAPNLPDQQTVEAGGMIMTPGFFDQHIHVTGGGGEGGPATRTPELVLSELVACGTTDVVGVSGTDYTTRSISACQGPRPSGRRRLRLDVHVQLPLPADASHRFHRRRPLLHSRGPRREDRPRRPPLELPRRPDGPLHARRHPRRRHARRQDRLPPHPQRQHSRRLRDV